MQDVSNQQKTLALSLFLEGPKRIAARLLTFSGEY